MANTALGILIPDSVQEKDAADLLRFYWSDETYQESLLVDVLMSIPTLTNQVDPGNDKEAFTLKDGYLFHDITPQGSDAYARKVILQLTKSLSGAAGEGSGVSLIGNEEDIKVKSFSAFANDWQHGVTTSTYGITYRENSPTKIYPQAKPLLSEWLGEYMSWNARRALLRRISNNLEATPISLTSSWNQNTYVTGATTAQPVYDEDDAVYEDNLLAVLDAATLADSHLTVRNILEMEIYARNKYIMPLKIEGADYYFLYVCEEEYLNLRDSGTTGSYAERWEQVIRDSPKELNEVIPGKKFMIGGTIVCQDVRVPAVGATGAPLTTIADYYLKQGRTDDRIGISATKQFNANLFLGKNSLVKFQPERPHFEEQYDEYKKIKGIGLFGACSYMIPAFDLGTKTATSVQQEGSMIVFTNRTLNV